MRERMIARERLVSQRLVGAAPSSPEDTVAWLLAVQAQEPAGAARGVGLRAQCSADAYQAALDDGRILRTHVMRPTWHVVAAADARWLLELTAPRVHKLMAGSFKKLGLTSGDLAKHRRAIAQHLPLSRDELAQVVGHTGIPLAHIQIHAELEQVMISAPRGFDAFDRRVPPTLTRTRDQMLEELARRYFASHGPARLHDLAWWSGLTLADCRRGAANLAEREGYYGGGEVARAGTVLLLPNFDEYLIAYRERPRVAGHTNLVIADGEPVGGWRRTPFFVEAPRSTGLAGAIHRYEQFAGVIRRPP